jgi:hypothetical protein
MNPYVAFITAAPFLDYGRAVILQRITEYMCQSPPGDLDVHGLPEMGKSMLLRYISTPDYVKQHGQQWLLGEYKERPFLLFCLYVTGWTPNTHPFIRLHHEFYRAYDRYYKEMARQHADLTLPQLSPLTPAPADPNAALAHLEKDVLELTNCGVRPVFLIDDFDKAFAALDKDQSSSFGSWKEYCSLIFATERLLEDVNADAKGSPLFKRLPQFSFGSLLPEDAKKFLLRPLQGSGVSFPPEDVDLILEAAGGFPYLLVLAGQALWEIREQWSLLDKGQTPLPGDAQKLLRNQLRLDFRRSYGLYYDNLKPEQQESLRWLARYGSLTLGDQPDRLTSQLSRLALYGLVDVVRGREMRVFSPLFVDYLRAIDKPTNGTTAGGPELTGFQQNLYKYLRSRSGQVSTFEDLGRSVWQAPADELSEVDKRRIHIAVSKLRRQLKATTGERIVSLRGQGYRLEPTP